MPLAHDAALADLERHAEFRHLDADPLAARIAQRGRPIVDRNLRRHHVHQLGFIRRRHDDEARETTEIGDVERTRMRRAVCADEACAVHREAHRQPLDCNVMHDLIVGALQEGRVDHREGLVALGRQAGAEGHAMLLGNADVERAVGKFLAEVIEPGA